MKNLPAIIGPITTLLAGLGGFWLAHRAAARREEREVRRAVYRRVVHHVSTFASQAAAIAKAPDRDAEVRQKVRDFAVLQADLEIDGSPEVQEALEALRRKLSSQEYADAVYEVHERMMNDIDEWERAAMDAAEKGEDIPPRDEVTTLLEYDRAVGEALEAERAALIRAVRKDLKPR